MLWADGNAAAPPGCVLSPVQVDVYLDNATVWTHVTLHNPSDAALRGYWWTNAQMPFTSPTFKGEGAINGHQCRSSDKAPGSRVISPAWGALTYGDASAGGMVRHPQRPSVRNTQWGRGRLPL